MKTRDDAGKPLIEPGDWIRCGLVSAIWDRQIQYDDPLFKTVGEGWDTCFVNDSEWFKVAHVFRQGDSGGVQGWSWLGHPLFCLIEIPPESVIYEFFSKPFDITEPVYGRDLIEFYGMKRELVHGKMIADIFEDSISDFKKVE